ncbi:unnamed protein product, partial [Effrenium voratum]
EGQAKVRCLQACGWGFWLVGQLLGQVAILLAPASLTACVTFSGSLLSNAVLAPVLLREQLTRMHGLSILLLGLGGFVVTSFSSHADQEYSWLQLRNFVKRPAFLCCAMTMIAVTTFLVGRALWNRFLDLLSFTYLFAVTGAVDLLVTKFTLQLLRLLVVVKTEQEEPAKKVVSTCIVMTLALHFGVFCFQVAAAYYRKALQSLPLFLGSGALMQVVVCGTFFDEFSSLEKHQKVFFSVGLALVMLGMVVTSMAGEEPQAHLAAGSKGDRFESLLERGHGSISSADLLLLGDIQKSALCWVRYEGLAFAAGSPRERKTRRSRLFASGLGCCVVFRFACFRLLRFLSLLCFSSLCLLSCLPLLFLLCRRCPCEALTCTYVP